MFWLDAGVSPSFNQSITPNSNHDMKSNKFFENSFVSPFIDDDFFA